MKCFYFETDTDKGLLFADHNNEAFLIYDTWSNPIACIENAKRLDCSHILDCKSAKEIDDAQKEKTERITLIDFCGDDFEFKKDCHFKTLVEIRHGEFYDEQDFDEYYKIHSFDYDLLGRCEQDCKYYLKNGARCDKYLWAGNVKDQITKMNELYDKMLIKPDWITKEKIAEYEKNMTTFIKKNKKKMER